MLLLLISGSNFKVVGRFLRGFLLVWMVTESTLCDVCPTSVELFRTNIRHFHDIKIHADNAELYQLNSIISVDSNGNLIFRNTSKIKGLSVNDIFS